MKDSKEIIKIDGFSKKINNVICVNNISFSVYEGSIHGFIGPNGAGKTTTIKTIIGAYTCENKSIKINGFDAGTIQANEKIGYVPEKASFPSNFNLYSYLTWMGRLANVDENILKEKIDNYLKRLNLENFKDKYPSNFSSGMQKKVLLIQALLNEPNLLILDEPTANLDPTTSNDVINLLIELRNEGKTIFISSHLLSELEKIVDSVTFLNKGNVLYSGSIDNLHIEYGFKYQIKTNNNNKAILIWKKNGINEEDILLKNDVIIIKNLDIDKINEMIFLLFKNSILIIFFKPCDLQNIYNFLINK